MSLVPSLQAGSQFGKYTFSHDSKFMFCCCGNIIKIFNTRNGELLHDLKGHSKTVTGVVVNPSNILQILSCGRDGLLISWDYLDGVKLKQHHLHMTLNGIISISAEKKSIIMLARSSEHKQYFSVMLWKKNAEGEYSRPKVLLDNCDGNSNLVSFGCSKEYIASALKDKLSVHSMKREATEIVSMKDKYNKDKAITCVACHPSDYCIATGLENGKIIIWHNFFKNAEPVTSINHWHALSVSCLEYTPDGSNLLSGGHECVLVRWQTNNTDRRDFKPRMGAPLKEIVVSPDGNFYATKHTDNVIQLMDISLKILQVYRGMTHNNFCMGNGKNPIPCGLIYDSKWRTIVLNGLLGCLQFYSVSLNKQIFNLDIVGQNYISPENLESAQHVTELLSAAISDDGDWLATFEMWEDGVFQPELRLKFWNYSTESQMYVLNTSVESPHEKRITSMVYRPRNQNRAPTLVTVGSDLCFKLWTLVDDTDIYRTNNHWTCESVGIYHDLAALCADFSSDGSTLVVGFNHLITIWDPDWNIHKATLSNSIKDRQQILNVKFGSGSYSHQLVAATSDRLFSWNLVTLNIMWSIAVDVVVLFRDPSSDLMAFVSSSKSLCVFRPGSAEPVYQHDCISGYNVVGAVFVPDGRNESLVDLGWPGRSQIYIFNEKQQLITLDLETDQHKEPNKIRIAQNLPASTLSTMLAEKLVRESSAKINKKTHSSNDSLITKFLHSNESISLHCDQYLHSFLVKKKQKKTKSDHSARDLDPGSRDEDMSSSESEEEVDTMNDNIDESNNVLVSKKPSEHAKDIVDMDLMLAKWTNWTNFCESLAATINSKML
ncbi:WD repeat-containing protein 75 [Biomphalaria glabrata]|nr:WD repeat-containing protein 75 [Biomphalaria glabrata]